MTPQPNRWKNVDTNAKFCTLHGVPVPSFPCDMQWRHVQHLSALHPFPWSLRCHMEHSGAGVHVWWSCCCEIHFLNFPLFVFTQDPLKKQWCLTSPVPFLVSPVTSNISLPPAEWWASFFSSLSPGLAIWTSTSLFACPWMSSCTQSVIACFLSLLKSQIWQTTSIFGVEEWDWLDWTLVSPDEVTCCFQDNT